MKTNKLVEIFEENDFSVSLSKQDGVQCAEIETWTTGGVNMIHYLDPFTVQEFQNMVDAFDVDEEIDGHRQDKRYRDAFRITESVKDFEEYYERLKDLLSKLQDAQLKKNRRTK